jgi:hypothetical protein
MSDRAVFIFVWNLKKFNFLNDGLCRWAGQLSGQLLRPGGQGDRTSSRTTRPNCRPTDFPRKLMHNLKRVKKYPENDKFANESPKLSPNIFSAKIDA